MIPTKTFLHKIFQSLSTKHHNSRKGNEQEQIIFKSSSEVLFFSSIPFPKGLFFHKKPYPLLHFKKTIRNSLILHWVWGKKRFINKITREISPCIATTTAAAASPVLITYSFQLSNPTFQWLRPKLMMNTIT